MNAASSVLPERQNHRAISALPSAPVIRERVAKDTVRGRSCFALAEMMRGVARTASGLADRIDPARRDHASGSPEASRRRGPLVKQHCSR
jgi:hypothetical protein